MTGVSTLGQSLSQITRLKSLQTTMDELQRQVATGKQTDRFSGLGSQAINTQRARAELSALETYQANITTSKTRIELTINTLQEIAAQAENVQAAIQGEVQAGEIDLETVQDITDNIFQYMFSLINTKDGDRYLLAGADAATQPIADDGLMEAYMGEFVPDETNLTNPPITASGVIGDWGAGTITTEQFISTYRATSDVTLGYSAPLTSNQAGSVFVRADENLDIDYTVEANTQGIKDIMIAMGVIRELPPVEFAPGALNDPTATTLPEDQAPFPPAEKQDNFYQVFNDLGQMMEDAIDMVNREIGRLSNINAQLERVSYRHDTDILIQEEVISDIEDVDITEAAIRINALQFQVEASFTVTSVIQELSLTRFI